MRGKVRVMGRVRVRARVRGRVRGRVRRRVWGMRGRGGEGKVREVRPTHTTCLTRTGSCHFMNNAKGLLPWR